MNRLAIVRMWPFAAAFAFIVSNTTLLRGQRDPGELVFEPPAVIQANPQRRPGPLGRSSNINQIPSKFPSQVPNRLPNPPAHSKPISAEYSGVVQVGGTMPLSNPRTPIPGTEPNKGYTSTPSFNRRPMPGTASSVSTAPGTAANHVTPLTGSGVTTAGHVDPMQGVLPDGGDPALLRRRQAPTPSPVIMTPTDRGAAPAFKGSLLGLNSGETATERLIQLRTMAMDLERQNDELRQQNTGLMARLKERDDQLQVAVREIKLARNQVGLAKSDLERMRGDLQTLREKVRLAEKEHSAVLHSMGPLLQQLLESDDVGSLPPNPME